MSSEQEEYQKGRNISQRAPYLDRTRAAWKVLQARGYFSKESIREERSEVNSPLYGLPDSTGDRHFDMLSRAFEECELEKQRVRSELSQLKKFEKGLSRMSAPTIVGVGDPQKRGEVSSDSDVKSSGSLYNDGTVRFDRDDELNIIQLSEVVKLYRETVMDIDYIKENYTGSPVVHMSHEFGEGIAKIVGSGGVLSHRIKAGLKDRCQCARDVREDVLDGIDEEIGHLEQTREELARIDGQFDSACDHVVTFDRPSVDVFLDVYNRVERLESDIHQLVGDRRDLIWDPPVLGDEVPDVSLSSISEGEACEGRVPLFYDELYRRVGTIDPVLSEAAEVACRGHRIRSSLSTLLASTDAEVGIVVINGKL